MNVKQKLHQANLAKWAALFGEQASSGDIPMDNNLTEQASRPFTIGRNYVLNQVMCC